MNMRKLPFRAGLYAAACAMGLGACAPAPERAANVATLPLGTSAGINGLLTSSLVFMAVDADRDNVATRSELSAAAGNWFAAADAGGTGLVTIEQLVPVLDAAMPRSGLAAIFNMGGGGNQPQTPVPATVDAMMAALPERAPVQPARPRKVLVLARAAGFVHSSIPLAAKTIEALGDRTGAWTTTISYDAADITTGTLAQYDALFLASTTGEFLDAPGDPAATASRRRALLEFVRSGKGLAGIHASSDSYHADREAPDGGGAGLAGLLAGFSVGRTLAPVMLAQGDGSGDQRLDMAELGILADSWFRTLDTRGTGRLTQADFALLALMIPKPTGPDAPPVPQGPDSQVGTWPDFNRLIGGYFKYHWLDPQLVTVKIDDPASPLTTMFQGQSFDVRDEIYTMAADSWSRENVRVLTSIDYDRMSTEDRALEDHPRADRDYGLSWIRREGQGRVFYLALGHSERIYAMRPVLEHLLAGIQYATGDLQADDTPSRP